MYLFYHHESEKVPQSWRDIQVCQKTQQIFWREIKPEESIEI